MPKVSVIIPVYNSEEYLRKCLDSLINQTLSDIEIICINNCPTDNSYEILKEYSNKDKRIKIINFKENKGASIARNKGINEAKGEYISFVDSDDYVDVDFYEKLYNKALEKNADAVKGNIYNCDKNGEGKVLTEFYNMNDKIRENPAYFYYGFTSAIYKKQFLDEFEIRFPEGIKYFEDPYFSIKACMNYKTIDFVDSAKYYYVQHNQASRENHSTIENFKDFEKISLKIIKLLNNSILPEETYRIIFNFIYNFAKENYYNKDLNEDVQKLILNIAGKLVISSKYDYKIDKELFENMKNEIYNNKFYDELYKRYKEYDYLNSNKERPLVKILVSYIKPSFLFKTEILTPMHLGRAVEADDSKDGVQSGENLKWLHENCEFNDDFEGGISHENRRIGFLTGTYWAYKNYEKLGNPEYFGSFGYRKLLFPNCLEDLASYDLILPKKMKFNKTLKEQFIECHGKNYYDSIVDIINAVYPKELKHVEEYMQEYSGYYAEMYIMKKDLFFDFCEWIFKIVDHMMKTYVEFIESNPEKAKIKNEISNMLHVYCNQEEAKKNLYKKDLRDYAFILERLSGYYMDKLSKKQSCRIKEINVFEPCPKGAAKVSKEVYMRMMLNKMRKNVAESIC